MSRKGISPSRRGASDPFDVTENVIKGESGTSSDPFSYKEEPKKEEVKSEKEEITLKEEGEKSQNEVVEEKITEKTNQTGPIDPFSYKEEDIVESGLEENPVDESVETEQNLEGGEEEINPYFYLGNALKKDGFFNGEVDENISGSDIIDTYKKSVQEEAMSQIIQSAQAKLKQEGYDAEDLKYAKLLRNGSDEQLLRGAAKYESFAKLKLDVAEESDKKRLLTEYYKDRDWEVDEIEDQVERVILDDKLDEVSEKAVIHFKDKHKSIIQNEEAKASRNRQEQEQAAANQLHKVEEILREGKLLEDSISNVKEFRRSIYQKDFIAEIGGKEYPITELQNFLLSFENDPETKLWAFSKWKYRKEEREDLKEEAKKEAEEDLLGDYKKIVTKSKAKTTTRKVKQALNTQKSKTDWVSPTGNKGPIVVGR